MQDMTVETVMERWIAVSFIPLAISTDRGKQVESAFFYKTGYYARHASSPIILKPMVWSNVYTGKVDSGTTPRDSSQSEHLLFCKQK